MSHETSWQSLARHRSKQKTAFIHIAKEYENAKKSSGRRFSVSYYEKIGTKADF